VVGGDGNTTDTYRYATLNGVRLALPTAGGAVTDSPYFANATSVVAAAVNFSYDDLLAVWDAYNGFSTSTFVNGAPPGWQASNYWSATPSAAGHAFVYMDLGAVSGIFPDASTGYVALQVL